MVLYMIYFQCCVFIMMGPRWGFQLQFCFAKTAIEALHFCKNYNFGFAYPLLSFNSVLIESLSFALTKFVFINVSEKSNLRAERLYTI